MKNSTHHVIRQNELRRAGLTSIGLPSSKQISGNQVSGNQISGNQISGEQLPGARVPVDPLPLQWANAGAMGMRPKRAGALLASKLRSACFLMSACLLSSAAFGANSYAAPASAAQPLLASTAFAPKAYSLAIQNQPDQVFVREGNGALRPVSGVLTENKLTGVAVGSDRFDSDQVAHITFGSVPSSFREAKNYFERRSYAEAAAKYRLAAGESDRNVVQAAARLRAAQALLYVGSVDSSAFADADREATRFLEDFPDNREVPRGRYIQATARFLSGDAAAAGALFQAIYDEVTKSVPSEGYDIVLGYKSGLRGASAYLEAGMTQEAREIFQRMTSTLPSLIAGMTEEDRNYGDMLEIQASARLGEGFALLAGGNSSRAVDFFREQLNGAATASDESSRLSTAALTFGARLGLGLSLAKEGQYRQAQIELAIVSSLDHTDRDRVARALLGLAECALNLPDSDSRSQARAWVETVLNQYSDTLWVQKAHALLGTL